MEYWIDIIGYEGLYQVSNKGKIKSLYKEISMPGNHGIVKYPEKILKSYRHKYGYLIVCLSKNGKIHKETIHKLVALHFVDNPNNHPYVLHIDDDSTNNNDWNLKWGTQQENMDLKVLHNRQQKGEGVKNSKLNPEKVLKIRELYSKGEHNQYELAKIFSISQSSTHDVILNKTWKHITQ